jgi:hypothetical protein
MNRAVRCLYALAAAVFAMAIPARGWFWQSARPAPSRFCPAYYETNHPSRLRLFPLDGPELSVALPEGLPMNAGGITFSADGEALYAQGAGYAQEAGIFKVEFRPAREGVIPGSVGMGDAWCVAVSPLSGKIIVASYPWDPITQGIYEVDPVIATRRAMPAGTASVCGGGGGVMSPDGRLAIVKDGKQFALVALKTGTVSPIKGTSAGMQFAWSPDGRWIAGVRSGRVTLIDADDTTRQKGLGRSGDGAVIWSPDSGYLLLRSSSLSCGFGNEGESLTVIDVKTGVRKEVKSSHCTVAAGTLGWLDRNLAQ